MTRFPLSIGYDYLFDQLHNYHNTNTGGFPPFNIVKVDDNEYKIEIALAGISKDEIEIVQEGNKLTVRSLYETDASKREFYHKGISFKKFTRDFLVADNVKVSQASHKDGLLVISLSKEIPEEKKPRKVSIL